MATIRYAKPDGTGSIIPQTTEPAVPIGQTDEQRRAVLDATGGAQPGADPKKAGTPGYDVFGNKVAGPVSRYTTPPTGSPTSVPGDPAAALFEEGGPLGRMKPYTQEEQDAIRQKEYDRIAAQVAAIDASYAPEFALAADRAKGRLGSLRATQAALGLAGSGTEGQQRGEVEGFNDAERRAVQARRDAAVAALYSKADDRAIKLAEQQQADAGRNAAAYLEYLGTVKESARADLTTLSKTGTTYDDLAASDPANLEKLLGQAGISEQSARALFIANAPQGVYINKDKPEIIGGKAVFFKQTPTGIVTESVELPEGAKTKEIQGTVNRDDGIYVLYKDGSYDKIGADLRKSDGSGPAAGYNGEFAATIKLISQSGGTNAQRAQIEENMKEFIANGDYGSAYVQVLSSTGAKLTGANASNFQQQVQSYAALKDMRDVLKEYEAAGGNTNIFKGGIRNIENKIGALINDPKYASIATRLESAFQQYRQNMTGAAFGAQESGEYASVLPSSGNTFALNMAKIDGAEKYLNSVIESSIKGAVGQGGIEIKRYAEGAKPAGDAPAPDQAEVRAAAEAAVGSTVEIGGKQYKKVGEDDYEEI